MCVWGKKTQREHTHTYLPPTHIYLPHIYIFPYTHRQRERERERERESEARYIESSEREREEREERGREDAETFMCTHICAADPLILSRYPPVKRLEFSAGAFCKISSFDR